MEDIRIPRIRNAKQAAEELKKLDPDTRIHETHIRKLMKSGKIPVITSGQRQFVNLDYLIDLLNSNPYLTLDRENVSGIRKIKG